MATSRATGYVPTATVWNNLFTSINDAGTIWSGAVNGSTGAFSSTLAVTGTSTLGTVNCGGLLSANAGLEVGAASFAAGRIYYSGTFGLTIGAETGSGQDFSIYNPGGSASILNVPTGTLNVDFGGRIKAAGQPGFLAHNSTDDTTVNNTNTIDFDTEVYDEAANFSGDTFTAPVTGRYWFGWNVNATNTSGSTLSALAVLKVSNNAAIYGSSCRLANNDTAASGGACIVDMDAGDTAIVQWFGGDNVTVEGGTYLQTWFSGRLVP